MKATQEPRTDDRVAWYACHDVGPVRWHLWGNGSVCRDRGYGQLEDSNMAEYRAAVAALNPKEPPQ